MDVLLSLFFFSLFEEINIWEDENGRIGDFHVHNAACTTQNYSCRPELMPRQTAECHFKPEQSHHSTLMSPQLSLDIHLQYLIENLGQR